MNAKLIMLPYKETSKGSKRVAEALGITRVLRDEDLAEKGVVALNWGRGDWPMWKGQVSKFINPPDAVMRAIDKLTSYTLMRREGVPITPFTTSRREAEQWLADGALAVFCRKDLQGQNASGVVVARRLNELVDAAVYTKYVRKDPEYRVHVMNGECFYANIKTCHKEKQAALNGNPLIRSGSHGWFFTHMDDLPAKNVQDACIAAVRALGLDFGGVDVGVNLDNGEAVVFEVNTAPESGPNTTKAYKQAFQKHYGAYKNNNNVAIKDIQ
jgi:hypothetical protein